MCSVGGGTHTKSVNRRATSVYDASVQLCAELNNANHGTVRLRFGVDGDWLVSAGNCINLAGYGKLDGKYFVDKVTHKVSASGLTTDFECSCMKEIARLRRELRDAKDALDVLKKAINILGK